MTPDEIRKLKELGELAALNGGPASYDANADKEAQAEYQKAYFGTLAELEREGH